MRIFSLAPNKDSFKLVSKKSQNHAVVMADVEAVHELGKNVNDFDKRFFLKALGGVGLGIFATTLFPKKADALVVGSTPTSNVVGVKNSSNVRIDPATETTLAGIKTKSDQLLFDGSGNLKVVSSGGGGGGNVGILNSASTQVNPATDDSAILLRRILKQVDSLGVVDANQRQKVTMDSISAGVSLPTVAAVTLVSGVTTVTTVTTVATVTAVTSLNQLNGVDPKFMLIDIARNSYANGVRQNLTFS